MTQERGDRIEKKEKYWELSPLCTREGKGNEQK
jgi:hypothetical protein